MKFSGFMNVYLLEDMSWVYKYGDKTLESNTLKDLELLVNLYGLKWHVLDKDLAKMSLEIDKNNTTGFLNAYKNGDEWFYRNSNLKSKSLKTLKKKVLTEGLEWSVTDKELADKNWKLDLKKFKK
jgi:hypothetical protein